jgi:LytS/YehU family sensor histidine kinase
MEAQLVQANLQILKMQVQPGLLVSTLSAISSKMHEDVEATDGMITRLGDLLRLTLDKANVELVALREELEGLDAYLGIEQARLGPDFVTRTDVDPLTLDARVPFLLLQPVVEEVIRRALEGAKRRGQITVQARRSSGTLKLRIEAKAKGLTGLHSHVVANEGDLAKTQTRLHQLYGKDFVLQASNGTPGHMRITIELPFEECLAA